MMAASGDVLVSGVVVPARLDPGSKSDRMAPLLVTEAGECFSLRKQGDNAFMPSSEVKSLFGQKVTLDGKVVGGSVFIYSHVMEQERASDQELGAVQQALEKRSLRAI